MLGTGIFLAAGILWKGLKEMGQRVTVKELTQAVVELSNGLAMLAEGMQQLKARLEEVEKQETKQAAVADKFVFGKGTTDGLSKHSG